MTRTSRLGNFATGLALGTALSLILPAMAAAADGLISGTVKSASGGSMGGVTVSAKAEGTTITTTVFSDQDGGYYFPPLPAGKYRVWAQALGFATAKSEADLAASPRQDFVLQPLTDFEQRVRQLPGDLILAGLPDATPDDRRLKQIVRNNCTSCHTPSYPLQHRFDETGWNAVIQTMKQINVYGVYKQGAEVNPVLNFHQKELAAYLARARGPGNEFKIVNRPRPTGEAARAVFTEYDVPLNPDQALPAPDHPNDGSDWTLGTPSRVGSLPHDAAADFDGNLWFAATMPNRTMSVGRIDAKTGAVKPFRVDAPNGLAAVSHGLIRDDKGVIWFNAHLGRGSLAKIDPKTEKLSVYIPPSGMSQIDGPVTLDFDGNGNIWAGTQDGVLRFDPAAEKFTEFKSVTPRTAKGGIGTTYGIAGDRDGNVWWTQMAFDTIAKSDVKTGKSLEWTLPPVAEQIKLATQADIKFYDTYAPTDIGTPFPWSQGPRRMGIDRATNVLWIANSWGGSLTRVNTSTGDMTFVPLPNPATQQPYEAQVDKSHNVWVPMWTTDQIAKYDPASSTWTLFDLPTRGTEVRIVNLLEQDGNKEVVFAFPRSSKVAVMKVRSEAELAALKQRAQP
ncbi:MAG TPA: carboxypeptidase regulatory-like domain-containing protein [Xanthobacteraceae bacterium]|jgi:streptogramin lyase|nr:carboxypeptidase regulatory-like domain-containing protein [Xanthobacteraceae bacterium]